MKKSLTNKLVVKHRMHMLNMAEGTPLNSHLDIFTSILMDLKNMDVKYDGEDFSLMLICYLPPSYNHFSIKKLFLWRRLKKLFLQRSLWIRSLFIAPTRTQQIVYWLIEVLVGEILVAISGIKI